MRTIILTLLLGLLSAPLFAQFYSYRDADGRLHITDRPIKKKGFKLQRRYIPPSQKEELRKAEEELEARRNRLANKRGKHVLSHSQIDGLVTPIAEAYGVDPELVKAVIEIESSRDVRAFSNKEAMGLMQLIPATADRFGVKNVWDPRQNVKGGIRYLRYLLAYFEGDVDLALAGYNAGENAVDKHGGVPPYKETRHYIRKIRRIYSPTQLPFDAKIKYRSKLVKKNGGKKAAATG